MFFIDIFLQKFKIKVMIEIFCVPKEDAERRLNALLSRHIPAPFEILRTENGKPYVEGNPVYFSVSHSGDRAVIAISRSGVGIDLENFTKKIRQSVLSRFPARERAEIFDEKDFLQHWTAREAYIKFLGLTLAKMWKHVEFYGGKIFVDGEMQEVKIRFYEFYYGIAALCSEK